MHLGNERRRGKAGAHQEETRERAAAEQGQGQQEEAESQMPGGQRAGGMYVSDGHCWAYSSGI